MAQCKVNKITIVCEKWRKKNIQSEAAMNEIHRIVDLKESDMPPCTCNKPAESAACPIKTSASSTGCPTQPKKSDCGDTAAKSGSCHTPGPMTINPFFNFMKELRETTCFNKPIVEVAKEAGCRWSKMSECDKAKYIVEAYKVSRKKGDGTMKRRNSNSSMCGPKSKVSKPN